MKTRCLGMLLMMAGLAWAQNPAPPLGVILVLIDDIGYGDIDVLSPSGLETPELDKLYAESVRLTDFHVGTTCSPARASLMTGRSVNAGGVWHTIAGRELLREDEQTVAEVFQANGWKTGIFGKWHLGEGYPFAPRFRGFETAVIHGGGGIGQGPDYWGNDYYAGDTYLENSVPVVSDRHCTDYWFERARQFIQQARSESKPFFCYLPTNAAHAPFNEPAGYKNGFDGLIENIDDNMGWLDDFLAAEGIKDDVLLIFSTDNGTAGSRLGGLRGKKGSHYDGGHNVPCFWRWKNGGLGGDPASARDVAALTAAMDVLPSFIDLFGLTRPPGGNPLHGTSLKPLLLDPAAVPTSRVVMVDTQRQAGLSKWRKACVMQDEIVGGAITRKWRLVRGSSTAGFELYDLLTDRAQVSNVAGSHGAVVTALTAEYDAWWADVSQNAVAYPPFVLNADRESELTLFSHSWIGQNSSPWNQSNVNSANSGSRTHAVRFDRTGRYRFELRRWPREDGGAIDGTNSSGGGTVVAAQKARVAVAGAAEMTNPVPSGDSSSVVEMDVPAGPQTTMATALLDGSDNVLKGAYYVYLSRIGDATDSDGDGLADVVEQLDPAAPGTAGAHDLLCFSSVGDLVAGRNAVILGSGPGDTVAAMSDGSMTWRLDSAGSLWSYPTADFTASGTNLGALFARANVRALMSHGSSYYVHLSAAAAGYAANNVVRFPSISNLLAGSSGVVDTSGSSGSTALMQDGTRFYKVRAGTELQGTTNLVQLITANGTVEGDLFCGTSHSCLYSDGTSYYLQVTREVALQQNATPADTDDDGTPDYLDTDSDDDGVPDAMEVGLFQEDLFDVDDDGVPDYRDADAAPAPFDHWLQQQFGRDWNDPARGGETSDFDGDSLVTLIEYALDKDPNTLDPDPVPAFHGTAGGMHLRFPRNAAATDLRVTLQGAPDLNGDLTDLVRSEAGSPYAAIEPGFTVGESVGPGGAIEVDVAIPPGANPFFVRLQVERIE